MNEIINTLNEMKNEKTAVFYKIVIKQIKHLAFREIRGEFNY